METRSRKRAEASRSPSSSGPNTQAAKRSRTSATSGTSLITTRSRSAAAAAAKATNVMEPTPEPSSVSASNTRSRRGKNPSTDKDNNSNNNSKVNPNLDKGKQKELDIRPKETPRSLGLNVDMHDEDNDSESGVGSLPHNLTSASSALQGLLRKLGAGLDDLLPSSAIGSGSSSQQSGRLKKILSGLRADGEEGKQVEALTQLCDMLSIGTEESLSTFSVESFVPVLVGLLNHENNADIMLLAARAITHLVDVLPSSCAAVVHYGAVSCFVAKLLTIEYMDLAEQSLQALKKISQEHPTACLRAGALMAVLSYIDFFSTGVQRVALSTAANICKKLPSDASDFVMEAVPLLTNILQYQDAKLLEDASVCLTRIAEAFASSSEKLDDLCNHGLVTQAASLISSSNAGNGQSLSTSTYTGLIRLLSTCASGSDLGAKSLLLLGISGILKGILSCSGSPSCMSVSPALSRPPEQIFEIVNLANELLPPLPEGMISLPASSSMFVKGPRTRKDPVVSSNGNTNEVSNRVKLLEDQPELLQQFGVDLLPVLVQIYGSSVSGPVRHMCLSVIAKLMYFSPAEMIQSLNINTNISCFLAGVLAWKDPQVLVPALNLADILMEKLPETFSKLFVKEGLVHAVDALILSGSRGTLSSVEKESDSISGSSTRPRRSRRRNGNSSSEVNPDNVSNSPALSNVPPNSTETTKLSSLRATVSAHAKDFKDKYFPSSLDGSEAAVTDDLLRLKNLCTNLNLGSGELKAKSKGKSKLSSTISVDEYSGKDEQMIEVIGEMLRELSREDGMSTFEFIGSGVISSLLGYFTFGYFSKERVSEESLSRIRQQAIGRYKSFVSISLPPNVDGGSEIPMRVLVKRLQDALSSLERFPVVLSHTSRTLGGTARLSSGLSVLSQPIKLRLCRAQGEKTLRDYSSNIVLIDPLASLAAVEDFLWSRVQRNVSSGQKPLNAESGKTPSAAVTSSPSASTTPATATRRHSTRSRSLIDSTETAKKDMSHGKRSSLSKSKGKAVLKHTHEEGSGPQSRNATRRRAAVEKENEMKAVDGDTNSEEDELEMSPIGMDDALVIEEDISDDDDDDDEDDDNDDVEDDEILRDDTLPYWLANSVHDVKLGDATEEGSAPAAPSDDRKASASNSGNIFTSGRGFGTSEIRTGTSFRSRGGAMSFAAAAMAGLTSGNNARGISGLRDRQGCSLTDPPKLIFTAGGSQLSRHYTIYQAAQRQFTMDDENDDDRFGGSDFISSDGSGLQSDIYTITYQKADGQAERSGIASSTPPSRPAKDGSSGNLISDASTRHLSLLDSIVQGQLPCDLERTNPTYEILALLRVLEGLNQLAPRLQVEAVIDRFSEGKITSLDELVNVPVKVSPDDFINSKLTPKLARQFQDLLALFSGSLPSWCYQLTKACPFLLPFEIRRQYFYSTAFGLSRALNRLQQQQGAAEMGIRVSRLRRQKVRVARNRILDSAAKVMEMYCSQKAVIEVEYFGEVGTGLGPTLEFYTLLSHDLQKVELGMWRSNFSVGEPSMDSDGGQETSEFSFSGGDKDIVNAPLGLFPRPWPPSADSSNGSQFSKVIEHFQLLGRVMAKALQDGRLLDLPLSAAFYKLLLRQDLDLHDIISFDSELGTTLRELHALVRRKQYLESKGIYDEGELRFRGASIEHLCLDFSVPGYPAYILKPGDINVDMSNLEEYVSLVVDATVGSGIMRQIEAFRSGFNQVFDISTLKIFSPNELDYLVCGRRELWKADSLAAHIKFDHGYTAKSPPIVNLLEIMCDFTPEQQRSFCQFVTGAPRLPPGGLAVLNPKLTIVRKHSSSSSAGRNAANNGSAGPSEFASDDDLPSVMTCANYLKLPPYSTKEIMCKKLLYAISEGQGSFDLS